MQRTFIILGIFLNAICYGQVIPIDTTLTSKRISRTDNLENTNQNYRHITVRKSMHNETEFYYEIHLDTLRSEIFRCDFVSLTKEPNDTTLERTSYYMDNNQFVAVVIKNYTNGKLVVSQCNYIKAENDKLEIVFPVPTSKYLTTDDIKLGLKEIRLLLESLKTHLYKKHEG